MEEVLTGPFQVAALVLLLAGGAKLRAPASAARALATIGLPGSPALVRVLAAGEIALAVACVITPGAATAAVLACLYATFALVALTLVRRRAACGCFGDTDAPASLMQVLLSTVLALVAIAAAASGAHGIGWITGRSFVSVAVLVLGTAGSAYGTVVAYTELPQAWASWRPR